MQCPFLHKMNVKFCGLCRLTMIPLNEANPGAEQCSGPDYQKCALVKERHDGPLPKEHCPFLCVGDAHSCSVAPFQKLITCNQTTLSRCTDDGHKYCQLFLAMSEAGCGEKSNETFTPDTLAFAPNHMWLDAGEERTCHVGVDAFFGSTLGEVDDVIYPQHGDNRRPMVRFKVRGVDFDLVFPNAMQGIEINTHLMVDPSAVLDDPYGQGWLFEGLNLPVSATDHSPALAKGLIRGTEARLWMLEECERLAGFVHENCPQLNPATGLLMQDGGSPCQPLAEALDHRGLVRLHSEFFNLRPWRTES